MRLLFFLIFTFVLCISPVLNDPLPKSFYSYLLEEIREDVVNASLLNLPKRTNVDILKMCIAMTNEKKTASLSDIEGAFLIYKWITQNININCADYNKDESPVAVYKSGIGSFVGISALFNIMCSNMNIESVTITGFNKRLDSVERTKRLFTKVEHYWNYIYVNNTYYLVDPTLAGGFCYGTHFQKQYIEFYFGTKPEFLIKTHFPTKEKYQFVDNKISEETWDQYLMRTPHFYTTGMKTITPENMNLIPKNGDKIIITYADSFHNEKISLNCGVMHKNYEVSMINSDIKRVNDNIEISLENVSDDAIGIILYSSTAHSAALYNVIN
jgi:hypothetical protein